MGVTGDTEPEPFQDLIRELTTVAATVGNEAAELALGSRAAAIRDVGTKSSQTDVVTAADVAVERLIRRRLSALRPGEPVLGEETGGQEPGIGAAGGQDNPANSDSSGGPGVLSWVVDPIDGTVNYLYGYPWYAVSVAAQRDGVSVAAAVVEPETGRCWTAGAGQGAWLDGRRLRVSAATRLDLALIGTGFAYRAERRRQQAAGVAGLLARVRDIRRAGAASLDLCAVAAGWLDGYVEHGLSRWDWAGGALIAAEAGAVVRLPGVDAPDQDMLVAVTPGIADELVTALADSGLVLPPAEH